jgi:hypothetical protein
LTLGDYYYFIAALSQQSSFAAGNARRIPRNTVPRYAQHSKTIICLGGGYHDDSSTLNLFNCKLKGIDEKLSAKQNSIDDLARKISQVDKLLEELVMNDANEELIQVHKERLGYLRDEKKCLMSEKQSLIREEQSLIDGNNLWMQRQNFLIEQERTGELPNVLTSAVGDGLT